MRNSQIKPKNMAQIYTLSCACRCRLVFSKCIGKKILPPIWQPRAPHFPATLRIILWQQDWCWAKIWQQKLTETSSGSAASVVLRRSSWNHAGRCRRLSPFTFSNGLTCLHKRRFRSDRWILLNCEAEDQVWICCHSCGSIFMSCEPKGGFSCVIKQAAVFHWTITANTDLY